MPASDNVSNIPKMHDPQEPPGPRPTRSCQMPEPTQQLRSMVAMRTAARRCASSSCPGGHGEPNWGTWELWIRTRDNYKWHLAADNRMTPWCWQVHVHGHGPSCPEDIGQNCSHLGSASLCLNFVSGRASRPTLAVFLIEQVKVERRAFRL